MKQNALAIILGGGQGSRLYPLTEKRSKPAVSIAGKYRLVDIPISNCINSDISRMFVLTQFNSASLNKHIKNTYHFSHFSEAFVDILAAEQTLENSGWFQGTADAVRQCMQYFLNHEFKYALILSGDQLYQMNLQKMIDAHEKSDAAISIATLPVNAKDATGFGILKTNNESLITSFIEKPSQDLLSQWTSDVSDDMKAEGRLYLASMGIYIFNKDLLIELMKDKSTTDFGKEIIPQAIENHRVLSYQYEGYWTDIGNIDSFFEANLELTSDIPKFNLFDNEQKIYTRARTLPPTKISGETHIHSSLIAEGGIIVNASIRNSVIGIRTRIGSNTIIDKSYIMGCDYYQNIDDMMAEQKRGEVAMGIGENCHIFQAIIDKNCRIGNHVTLNGGMHIPNSDDENITVKDGIIVVKKGAVLPDGFKLG